MSVQAMSGSKLVRQFTSLPESHHSPRRRRRSEQGPAAAAAVESLESRVMLAITPVAGAWLGGAFDSIGVFENGVWQLDLDRDGFVGDDSPAFQFGAPGDTPIVGDWNGNGIHSVGVQRGNTFFLDVNDDRLFTVGIDAAFNFGLVGDIPVVGNWNGVGGDEVGVFRQGQWSLDLSANRELGPGDLIFNFGNPTDVPVTGNWNPATLNDSVAVYRNGEWLIDRNENFTWDGAGDGLDQIAHFGTSFDKAFAGDFLGDNTDEIAVLQDPPIGDPHFFVRELSSFPVFTATAALTASDTAEEQARAALSITDDEFRDELFADEELIL